ncbi:MAG: hypothetical protein HY052_09785 [Proteobacteria bacterium]|nr:hypothetical protein [Pseudomonadota bacterium]
MSLGKKATYTGTIIKEVINAGSNSEHLAILLCTDDGIKYPLRLKGANPFEIDPLLNQLIGSKATVLAVAGSGAPVLFVDSLSDIATQPKIHPRKPNGPKI